MDTVYPEPTSLLYRRPVRKKLRGNAARHRTQPVTFAEIQEVDEENLDDIPEGTKVNSCRNKSDAELNRKFDEFRQLRDKKFSKSAEGECPSDETTPILDPIPSGCHPLDAVSSTSRNKSLIAPPKLIQRPSI